LVNDFKSARASSLRISCRGILPWSEVDLLIRGCHENTKDFEVSS
jgi:hypothetical protein